MNQVPTEWDKRWITSLRWMREKHHHTLHEASKKSFRRRHVPTNGMPAVVPAASKYRNLSWLPPQLVVPTKLPKESRLPKGYFYPYYGLSKAVWTAYYKNPMSSDVEWDPSFDWNNAFPPTQDGWERPTSDESFALLRLQGPNPWLLRRLKPEGGSRSFEVDYRPYFSGMFADVVCRFDTHEAKLVATAITVGPDTFTPGDPGWEQAKRIANALDARYSAFVSHLLYTHLIVGQAYALSTYALSPSHVLRPFLQFFTYGTLEVNETAYQALLTPKSYFIMSGFLAPEDVRVLFHNAVEAFDFDTWNVPADLSVRGLTGSADQESDPINPYVEDATLVWPVLADFVRQHLADVGIDDASISADHDLSIWYLTLMRGLPNTDHNEPLTLERLTDLLTRLIYNNVVHEICGDLSPILGSEDPADKATINLQKLRSALETGGVTEPTEPASMSDVFLLDQASYVSRFNVTGNGLLEIEPFRFIDDPRLAGAVKSLQGTLIEVQQVLVERNKHRAVTFARMFPRHWEASISF